MGRRKFPPAITRVCPVAIWAACILESAAADWPHLRGPSYSGVSSETNLCASFPTTGPNVLWRIPLGQGYSGFTVAEDRLFTQMQRRSGQYVICLRANTGEELWRYRYGWPWQPEGEYPGPYATPTLHEGKLYFAGTDGLIGCLDAANGRHIWTLNVTEKFRGRGTEFGYACSPLVAEGKVIVPVGGPGAGVVALNAADASVVWQSGDEPASYCSPLPITLRGRRLVIVFLQNSIVAIALEDGRQLWRHESSAGYDEHAALPLYQEPHLLTFAPFHGGARLFELILQEDKITGGIAWENSELSNDILSSILLGVHVYGFDIRDYQANREATSKGSFKCLEFATGKVLWSSERVGHASAIAADGKLVLLNDTGTLILARASPDAYEELGRAQIFHRGLCWTAPTLHRGRLFVRNQHEAACVWLGAGNPPAANRTVVRPNVDSKHRIAVAGDEAAYAPKLSVLARWYLWCVAAMLACAAIGQARKSRGLFYAGAFLFGAFGTSVLALVLRQFIFTWPVSLFVSFQLAVLGASRGKERKALSRIAAAQFLLVCAVYYTLCKQFFIVSGWGFLAGMLAAAPLSFWAARDAARPNSVGREMLWATLAFTVYFWSSGLFTIWRMNRG